MAREESYRLHGDLVPLREKDFAWWCPKLVFLFTALPALQKTLKASWFYAESRVDFLIMKPSADMGEDGLSCVISRV